MKPLFAVPLLATAMLAQAPSDDLLALEPVLRAAIDKIAPSIVTVETFGGVRKVLAEGRDPEAGKPPDEPEKKPEGDDDKLGPLVQPGFLQAQGATTGLVLSADGWIAVSRFALNFDPPTVLVTLPDGRSFNAVRAGEDTSRGIALLKIDARDLSVPEHADPKTVRVGQWAFALGRTFGRGDPSVHIGIVSALGRLFGRAVQTDASTSPANYGGPLIDVDGRVLGICAPLSRGGRDAGVELYDSGIGFATTLAGIEPLLERMKRGEVLHRGWLGIAPENTELGPGARLASVLPGGPAAAAGLTVGERVVAVDGVPVRNGFHLQMLISGKTGGEPVFLVLVTPDGGRRALTVFLADLPAEEREARKPAEEAGVLPWEEGEKKKDEGR
jgi:serine protease Do